MANGNQGNAVIFIKAQGTAAGPTANPPNLSVTFNDPVQGLGGLVLFDGAASGPESYFDLLPNMPASVKFGGTFAQLEMFAALDVTSGNTIEGTITAEPPFPYDLTFEPFNPEPQPYTLPAGATSGNFTFPFSPTAAAVDVREVVRKKTGR